MPKAQEDPKELLVHVELKGLKVPKGQEVLKEISGHKERKERKERKDLEGHKVSKVLKVL